MKDGFIGGTPKACAWDFVVTVPANWPAEVANAMTRVVKLALNLGSYLQHSLTLMAEPDAAALGVFAGLHNMDWKVPLTLLLTLSSRLRPRIQR